MSGYLVHKSNNQVTKIREYEGRGKTSMIPTFLFKQGINMLEQNTNTGGSKMPRMKHVQRYSTTPNSKLQINKNNLQYSPLPKSTKQINYKKFSKGVQEVKSGANNPYKSSSTLTQDTEHEQTSINPCELYSARPYQNAGAFMKQKNTEATETTTPRKTQNKDYRSPIKPNMDCRATLGIYSKPTQNILRSRVIAGKNGKTGRFSMQPQGSGGDGDWEDRQVMELTDRRDYNFQLRICDFVFLKELGRGKNAVVYLGRHRATGFTCAIKVLLKSNLKTDSLKENLFRQLKIHSFLKHPNITPQYKIMDDPNFIYIFLEYTPQGTLYSLLKQTRRMSQMQTASYIGQICSGLKYLHDRGVMHRDLKLQNVLLTYGVAKIADFGCAVSGGTMRDSCIGSPAYLAPELLASQYYTNKIDIWSVGIMTYQLLYGTTPFDRQIMQALAQPTASTSACNTTSADMVVRFCDEDGVSVQAKNFIQRCLEKKQYLRIGIEQVLVHPFLDLERF